MNTVKEFVENFVKIEYIENSGCFGHYPFQLFVETSDEKIEINALALGGDVLSCYKRVSKYLKEKANKVFMSIDFPTGGDIKNDFVCIFSIVDNKFDIFAIPYNSENGEIYDEIHESNLLIEILNQFKSIVLN